MTDYETARRVLDGPVSWDLVSGFGKELHQGLIDAWHWGAESVIKYLSRKVANQVQYVFDLKFAEAEKALRLQAFTIAGIKNAELLGNVKDILIDCLDEGLTFQQFQDRAGQVIDKPRWHLELIYRNNLMTAFHTGRYDQLMDEDVRQEFPLWEYNAILDGAVRPSHAAMDGKRFWSYDPIWDMWYPPNGHNCRCGISAVSKYEMEEENIRPTGPPPVSVEPDFGWERNAGKDLVWLEKWQEGKMRGIAGKVLEGKAEAKAEAEFKPAKTVAEAEEWARQNNLTINANYVGVSVENANIINSTVERLSKKYKTERLDLLGIEGKSKYRKKMTAIAAANGREIKINKTKWQPKEIQKSYFDSVENYENSFKGLNLDHLKAIYGNWTGERIFNEKSKAAKFKRYNVFYKSRIQESVITHEFGHVLDDQIWGATNKHLRKTKFDKLSDIRLEWIGITKKIYEDEDIYKISAYADTHKAELFAECFAMYEINPSELPRYVKDFFDLLLEEINKL